VKKIAQTASWGIPFYVKLHKTIRPLYCWFLQAKARPENGIDVFCIVIEI